MERLKKSKSPIIRELIEQIESGEMPDPIFNKIMQEINLSIVRECESLDLHDPGLLQLRIFKKDYIVYQRVDNKLEMIEKKFYELLKCKYII